LGSSRWADCDLGDWQFLDRQICRAIYLSARSGLTGAGAGVLKGGCKKPENMVKLFWLMRVTVGAMASSVGEPFGFAEFTLDLTRGCLLGSAGEIELRPKSFELLRYLVENAGRLIPKTNWSLPCGRTLSSAMTRSPSASASFVRRSVILTGALSRRYRVADICSPRPYQFRRDIRPRVARSHLGRTTRVSLPTPRPLAESRPDALRQS